MTDFTSTAPPAATWVLLRGLTRSSVHWGDFPQALAQALPGARVVLRFRPVTGKGELVRLEETGQWCVRLDDGVLIWADEGDLFPDQEA